MKRREPAAFFESLERATLCCDESAARALTRKFTEVLPSKPRDQFRPEDDERLFDVMVELAAYAWLRTEFRDAELIEFVEQPMAKSADLRMKANGREYRIEAKNIHESREIRAALRAGDVVSGRGGIRQAFIRKLESTLGRARDQLEGASQKVVFLNYTPDPDLWMAEQAQFDEVAASFREAAPTDVLLVVFRNYEWTEPLFKFEPTA